MRKLGQKSASRPPAVWVRSLANCAIPPGGKPSVARVVRSAIRVCQRGTPAETHASARTSGADRAARDAASTIDA